MPLKMFEEKKMGSLQQVTQVLGVAAGKGGVGKSTVAVNVGLALKSLGYSVGIMDVDIYGPSVRKMLPEDRLPAQKGETLIPALCQGIKVISMAYFRNENEAAVVRAPIANNIVTQFIKNVDWGPLDYLLIDFPPGTGDVQLTLCQQANLTGAIVVTTPQEVAVLDVRKAVHMFAQVKIPIVGIVENMSYFYHHPSDQKIYLFGRGGGERLAREVGVPFLGTLPIDPEICRCGDAGESLFANKKEHGTEGTQAFFELTEQIVAQGNLLKRLGKDNLHHFELLWEEKENL